MTWHGDPVDHYTHAFERLIVLVCRRLRGSRTTHT